MILAAGGLVPPVSFSRYGSFTVYKSLTGKPACMPQSNCGLTARCAGAPTCSAGLKDLCGNALTAVTSGRKKSASVECFGFAIGAKHISIFSRVLRPRTKPGNAQNAVTSIASQKRTYSRLRTKKGLDPIFTIII